MECSQGTHMGGEHRWAHPDGEPATSQPLDSPGTPEGKGTGCRVTVNPTWVQLRDLDRESSCPGCS